MKTQLTFLRNPSFIVSMAILMALCLALAGVSARSPKKPTPRQASQEIQVRNYTNAFQIIGTESVGDSFVISLKNVSQKAISAYSQSLGPVEHPTNTRDTDGAVSGQVISPGEIHREEVPLIAFVHSAETNPSHESIINFVAVLFDDRSSEGRPEAVRVLLDRRIGERTQIKRMKRLLNEAVGVEGKSPQANLEDLKARISQLSVDGENGESDAFQEGLLSAKRHMLVMLEHLTEDHGGIQVLSGPQGRERGQSILASLSEQAETWLSRY